MPPKRLPNKKSTVRKPAGGSASSKGTAIVDRPLLLHRTAVLRELGVHTESFGTIGEDIRGIEGPAVATSPRAGASSVPAYRLLFLNTSAGGDVMVVNHPGYARGPGVSDDATVDGLIAAFRQVYAGSSSARFPSRIVMQVRPGDVDAAKAAVERMADGVNLDRESGRTLHVAEPTVTPPRDGAPLVELSFVTVPGSAAGTPKRTPTEVLIHLLHELTKPGATSDGQVITRIRDKLLQHDLKLGDTRMFMLDEATRMPPDQKQLVEALVEQLPDPGQGQSNAPTRLHDNVYGRVLDSAIIDALVQNPPSGVRRSMDRVASAVVGIIDADVDRQHLWAQAAAKLQTVLREPDSAVKSGKTDPRFWFRHVPGIIEVRDAPTPADALAKVRTLLQTPATTGQGVIARAFLLAKLSIAAQQVSKDQQPDANLAPWITEASNNYVAIVNQVGRTDQPASGDEKIRFQEVVSRPPAGDDLSGITLRHHLNPFGQTRPGEGPAANMRPTLRNMPELNAERSGISKMFPTASVQTALESGAPFASGVSGTTNILLHLLRQVNANPLNIPIDAGEYLLGVMMFLTYDGGHSMHEALWTANQMRTANRGIGLQLDDGDDPTTFVGDYQKLAQRLPAETRAAFEAAMAKGLAKTTEHFAINSQFSTERNVTVG